MMARSAMPSRVKRASLTQEGLRMMRNTSLETPLGGEGDHADRPLSQDEDVGILREIQTQHHRVHLDCLGEDVGGAQVWSKAYVQGEDVEAGG